MYFQSQSKWLQTLNSKLIANHGVNQNTTEIQSEIAQIKTLSRAISTEQNISVKLIKSTVSVSQRTQHQAVPFLARSAETILETKNNYNHNSHLRNLKLKANGSLITGSLDHGSLNYGSLKNGAINEDYKRDLKRKLNISSQITASNQTKKIIYTDSDLDCTSPEIHSVELFTKENDIYQEQNNKKVMESSSLVEGFERLNKDKLSEDLQFTDKFATTLLNAASQKLSRDVANKIQATTSKTINKNNDSMIEEELQYSQQEQGNKENRNNKHFQEIINYTNCLSMIENNSNYLLDDFLLLDLFENEYNQINSSTEIEKNNKNLTPKQISSELDKSGAINSDDDLFRDEESYIITEQGISTQDYELHLQGCNIFGNLLTPPVDHTYCTSTLKSNTPPPLPETIPSTSADYLKFLTSDSSPSTVANNGNPMLSDVAYPCLSPLVAVEDDWIPISQLHNNDEPNSCNNKNNNEEMLSNKSSSSSNQANKVEDDKISERISLKRKSSENDTKNLIVCSKKSQNYQNLQIRLNVTTSGIKSDISTPDLCDFVLDLENLHRERDEIFKHDKNYEICHEVSVPDSPISSTSVTLNSEKYPTNTLKTDDIAPKTQSFIKIENPPSVQSNYSEDFWTTSISSSTAPPTPSTLSVFDASPQPIKKRRGRPPKPHSALPDPEEMRRLSESERRYKEQRYKNNEASRQSRQNRKRKEEEAKEEEETLVVKNKELENEFKRLQLLETQLKKALSKRISIR